jgi:Protein of unknown function (DUF2800)
MAHAFLSPSGAPAWTRCEAKVHLERGMPDKSGKDAAEGTAAHFLRAHCLTTGEDAAQHLGRTIVLWSHAESDSTGEDFLEDVAGCRILTLGEFLVTDEMADAVQRSIDVIRTIMDGHPDAELHVELPLDISPITGEEGAKGTSDTVILLHTAKTLIVDDYKHGRGVAVPSEDNEQLVIYAGAALAEFDLVGDWQHITMRISQPRINNDSEWTISRDALLARLDAISATAKRIREGDELTLAATPGEKQCRFCKAKATCKALRDDLIDTVIGDIGPSTPDEFDEIVSGAKEGGGLIVDSNVPMRWLEAVVSKADLFEALFKEARGELERRLLAGEPSEKFKLVEGRRGSRKWSDEKAAEETLKAMRVKHDQMYDYSVISPTSAEKLAKAEVIGPRQWPKLQALITQSDGKPSVAPASDKRPAITVTPTVDEFDDMTAGGLV